MATKRCPNPECEFFDRVLPNNAKVCPMCCTPLGGRVGSAPPLPRSPFAPVLPQLQLVHRASDRSFALTGTEGIIGRRSQNSSVIPEIDLTHVPEAGIVSRSHARVRWDWEQEAYMLTDLSSRNGTFLNGMRLQASIPYRLSSEARLQLGQNELVILEVVGL